MINLNSIRFSTRSSSHSCSDSRRVIYSKEICFNLAKTCKIVFVFAIKGVMKELTAGKGMSREVYILLK